MPKRATCHPDRDHHAHGLCQECCNKEYYAKNREVLRKKGRAWYAQNRQQVLVQKHAEHVADPTRAHDANLRFAHGISRQQYLEIPASQNGTCAICQGERQAARRLHVDHDPATRRIRGLLCFRCNGGLGYLRHDRQLIERAIAYLQQHGASADRRVDLQLEALRTDAADGG